MAVWPDGWGRYHVTAPGGKRIGYVERSGASRSRGWEVHDSERRRLQGGMSTQAAAVAEPVRRHRERTPATDAQAPDLEGWRLTQTLDERDRHHYRLIDPGGRSAGTVERPRLGVCTPARAAAPRPRHCAPHPGHRITLLRGHPGDTVRFEGARFAPQIKIVTFAETSPALSDWVSAAAERASRRPQPSECYFASDHGQPPCPWPQLRQSWTFTLDLLIAPRAFSAAGQPSSFAASTRLGPSRRSKRRLTMISLSGTCAVVQ